MTSRAVSTDADRVAASVGGLRSVRDDLAAMLQYARDDQVAPAHFGALAAATPAAAVDRVEALVAALEESLADLAEVADGLTAADRALAETDADAAALIRKAGDR